MKTRIVVDSTADILPEYLDQIHTVPLTVSFGEEEYIDGVTIDHRTFYQKLTLGSKGHLFEQFSGEKMRKI